MKNPLDTFPYDWTLPLARDLHMKLCQLFMRQKDAVTIAQQAGIQAWDINAEQTTYFVWKDILELAARSGALKQLVTAARDKVGKGAPSVKLLDDLLANVPIVATSLRGPNNEAPYDEALGERETLLYQDNLMLSAGRVDWLIGVLNMLKRLSPAVCRLECMFGNAVGRGTGFRIGPDLLLTNWHVLYADELKKQADSINARFGYEQDAANKGLDGTKVDCTIVAIGDSNDDWGVVRTATPLGADIPTIALSAEVKPTLEAPAFLIQHPNGSYKRIGYVRNQVTSFDDQYVYYLTDTEEGSSGSPVFDEIGGLIALHHFGGTPQEIIGKAPTSKNRGIRITRVIAGLAKAGIAVP